MFRVVFLFAVMAFGFSFADDAVPSVAVTTTAIPAEWLPVLVLVVNAVMGLLQKGAYKLNGPVGKILQAVTDLLSANVKHK